MSNKIAPKTPAVKKTINGDKHLFSKALQFEGNNPIETPAGTMTMYQAVAARLWNTALLAENAKDATTAAKLIFERLEGRAAVEKTGTKATMPKLVFAMNETELQDIKDKAAQKAEEEDDGSVSGVQVDMPDGTELIV